MIDYILNDSIAFHLLNKVGREYHCKFKVDVGVHPTVFAEKLYPGSQIEIVEVASGTPHVVEVMALHLNEYTVSYSVNMTGSCVFRLLSTHTQPDTLESLF